MKRKKETYVVQDFGSVNIPESWDDVTLEQFMSIMRLMGDDNTVDIRDAIAILTRKDKEWVNSLPINFVNSLASRLVFLNQLPSNEARNEVEIDGEKYFINYMEDLTFGEYTDIDTVMRSDDKNYAAFLAILCRKEGEKYDDKFTAHIDKRVEMWNNVSITKVLPLISFFLNSWGLSERLSQDSLKEMLDQANQSLTDTKSLLKSGAYKGLPFKSRMKITLYIRRFSKALSLLSSSISPTSKKKGLLTKWKTVFKRT